MAKESVAYIGAVLDENPYLHEVRASDHGYGGSWIINSQYVKGLPEITDGRVGARSVSFHSRPSTRSYDVDDGHIEVDLINPGVNYGGFLPNTTGELVGSSLAEAAQLSLEQYLQTRQEVSGLSQVLHTRYWSGIIAIEAARAREVPTIFTPDVLGLLASRGTVVTDLRVEKEKEALHLADVVTVNTIYQRDAMVAGYAADDTGRSALNTKTVIIPPGVNTDIFNPVRTESMKHSARQEWNIPAEASFVAVTGGRASAIKNYEAALQGFNRFVSSLPEAEKSGCFLVMAIEDNADYTKELKAAIKSFGSDVREQIRFVGFQPQPIRLYGAGDVFISTSRSESFGSMVTESMSSGVPVIVSDLPSFREQIGYEEPSAPANLADLVVSLHLDPGVMAEGVMNSLLRLYEDMQMGNPTLTDWLIEQAKKYSLEKSVKAVADKVLMLLGQQPLDYVK